MVRKKNEVYVVTTLDRNIEEEHRSRVKKYSILMSVRFICIFLLFVIPFPWNIAPIIIAIFSPWFAVVIANVQTKSKVKDLEKPYRSLE